MPTLPQITPFEQAVRHSAREAMARYDSAADSTRIGRAMDLILAGHMTLLPTGEADVRSQRGHGSYHVNGACQCPDFAKAEAGRCKHRYAKALLKRAYRILAAAWYATYSPTLGAEQQGIAFAQGSDWMFIPEGQAAGWPCDLDALVLGGNVVLADAQHVADGNLAAKVCGS